MKKIIMILFLLANFGFFFFAQEVINSDYYGTYIPLQFEKLLNDTKSYSKSLKKEKNYHDILFVGKKGIYSDLGFHDGYKITNAVEYEFYTKDSYKYVVDDKKNIYKAIYIGNKEKNYQAFYEYVVNTMFKNSKKHKNINIEGDAIKVENLKLFFIADLMFFDSENCDAWFYTLDEKENRKKYYALINNGNRLEIVEGIKDEDDFGWMAGTKVIFEFPKF